MSSKNKIGKFRENETFECLIQPTTEEIFHNEHSLKGRWHEKIFQNNHPIILELGCGKGDYTIALAQKYPENNYIGVDIKGARLWKGAKYATENRLPNVAFLRTRIEFIESIFGADEISEIWLTFSDPQPKKPKKRLTSQIFLDRYSHFLKANGVIRLKTDSNLLYESTLEVIADNNHHLMLSDNDIYHSTKKLEENLTTIRTFYESQFLAKGISIKYIEFTL